MVVVPEITHQLREAEILEAPPGDPAAVDEEPTELAVAPEPDAAEPAEPETPARSSLVPVGEPRKRRSLWRRLVRRSEQRPSEPSSFEDLVKSRLDGITLRLESFEHGLARSDARLDSRFAVLESIEKRLHELADISERADQAREMSNRAAAAANDAAATARIAATVAGVAVVAAVGTLAYILV